MHFAEKVNWIWNLFCPRRALLHSVMHVAGDMVVGMSKQDRRQSLVLQAGILAASGIVVRLIGLFYNRPLVDVIGDEGFGYYDSAYAAYSIILLISSYSIPAAVSKIMAHKLALGEYKNAFRIFKCTLAYVVVVGLAAALFVFFGAGVLVKMENAVLPLKILAPTIFLSGILGAFRGFFQAQRSMVQTSISQIIEQIFNAVFSVWMAYVLVGIASGMGESIRASYGAAGSTIGTGVGVLSALIFMLLLYFYNRKNILAKVNSDTTVNVESYKTIFKMVLTVVTPFIISTGVYNINIFIDKTIYQDFLMRIKDVAESQVAFELSAYAKANKLVNIPIALASAMATTLIPRLSGLAAVKNTEEIRKQIDKATKVTMFIAIPSAVGLAVLAKPVIQVIFPQKASLQMAGAVMIILAVTVVLYGLSTITQAVLQAIGHIYVPILNALTALVVHAGIMMLLIKLLPAEYAIYVYGGVTILYSLILCILNGISVRKYIGYSQEYDKTFLRPLISSLVMGAVAFLIYKGVYALTGINIAALLVSVAAGVIIYFFMCVRWKAIEESELITLPKGKLIVKTLKKMRILRS